ncbi:MAG TPA: flagellar basal-body MS-ring/collar protein FliF [Acidisarcina sp.]
MNQTVEQAKRVWHGMGSSQRGFAIAGALLTVAVVVVFAKLIAAPDYKPLMTGVDPADAPTMTGQLAAANIPFQVSPDGRTISVPSDKVDAARLDIASHDAPRSGRLGFEIFDKVSWGQTEFDEKVNYQRALEGELERTIQTMRVVKSARVHIVMASDSVFLDRERGAKASVTLQLRNGTLSRDDFSAISRLVAGAVDNLKQEDVAIIDADSNESLGTDAMSASGQGMDQELTRRLVATLAPVLGAEHIRASVTVELEPGTKEESQEKYDPQVSVPLSRQTSEDQAGGGLANGGVPGTASNVPSATKPPVTATVVKETGESSKTESATYGVNRTTMHTTEPAGRVRRMTAAVLVDDAVERRQEKGKTIETRHKRTADDMKQITDLAQAAIGLDSTRGDVITVQNMSFEWPDPVTISKITKLELVRKGLLDYSSVIRYAALLVLFLLVYFLMLRPVQNRALGSGAGLLAQIRTMEPQPAAPMMSALQPVPLAAPLRTIALKRQLADFVKAEPESGTSAVRSWLREDEA